MYLDQPRAFGAAKVLPAPVYQVLCPQDSVMAGQVKFGSGLSRDPYSVCGGKKRPFTPPALVKPKFKQGYNLTGVYSRKGQLWYGNCKSGYVKQMVNLPDPNAYSCFDPAELAWNKKNGIMF